MIQPVLALDQFLNTLLWLKGDGFGMADEVISARAYRLRESHPWLIRWIDRVFFWDRFHCQECFGMEMARVQLPSTYQDIT